jgi:hypothetical protein
VGRILAAGAAEAAVGGVGPWGPRAHGSGQVYRRPHRT